MASSSDARGFRNRIERVESLIHEVERFADPEARACTQEILAAVIELHGAAIERILEKVAGAGETGLALIDALAGDDLVGCVLLLHGLHPLGFAAMCQETLAARWRG